MKNRNDEHATSTHQDWRGRGWQSSEASDTDFTWGTDLPRDDLGFVIEPLVEDFVNKQDVRYEPPRDYARGLARQFVAQHLEQDIDPDQLMIITLYVLDRPQTPPAANVAYAMTLTDALLRNWQQNGNGEFLDHLSVLRPYREGGYPAPVSSSPLPLWDCFAYEAIYHRTSPQRFDASTHTPLDPKVFKRFVWDANLQSRYLDSLKDFWARYQQDYNLLIKAALLKSAYLQHREDSLSDEHKALVLRSVGLSPTQAWENLTFKAFVAAALPGNVTFRELIVYRYTATDIIVIVDEQTEGLVAYIPGNSSPLHGFDNLTALRQWIAQQCRDPQKRKSLESHFKLADDGDGVFASGVHTALAGLAAYPHRLNDATGTWIPSREITLGSAISPWPFSHFRQNLEERFSSDAVQIIRTQADYNKEVAAQGLSYAIAATGMIAMVVPSLWLPLSAMSLALTGLGVDEVINGKTTEERRQGVDRLIFGVLNAVPEIAKGAGEIGRGLAGLAEAAPGAADEVGQMIENRSVAQKAEAAAELESAQTRVEEEALERASEDTNQQAMRLHQHEQQRLALRAEREAALASQHRFGVEPEGLRSLTPDLRAALEQFEYKGALKRGEWTRTDAGSVYKVNGSDAGKARYFVRVHTRTYPAEWVETTRQYRIVSLADDTTKGPYVKPLYGFYSDLDLKPGLRGGESYSEALAVAAPEAEPVASEPDIVLVRAQPPINIGVPMDGIERRMVADRFGNETERYFALNTPDGTRVYYDADLACWKNSNTQELLWLDNNGTWKVGSERRYQGVRKKLRLGIRDEIYTFPRIPGLAPDPLPIDRTVHQIWMGEKLPGAHLLERIKTNIKTSPDLAFTLHIDIDDAGGAGALSPQKQLQQVFAEFPGMKISNLHDEPFFEDFLNNGYSAAPFAYFRRGINQNLAAASDVLRYRLIREYGGIYMDCDDVLRQSFKGRELSAGPSDVLVGETMTTRTLGYFGPNPSHFASHPDNAVLRAIEKELFTRFMAHSDELAMLKLSSSSADNLYMKKIFHVTGPQLFLDTMKKTRPDYAGLLDQQYKFGNNIYSTAYIERLTGAKGFYAPFADRLRITTGSENSWSDLVLGGSSDIVVSAPVPESELSPGIRNAVMQPDLPPIRVAIPLEGVSESNDGYSVLLDGKTRRVIYDADMKVWKLASQPSRGLMLDADGEWRTRSVIDGPLASTAGSNVKIVEMPPLPRLPSNARPLPRKIHYLWLGDQPLSQSRIENIVSNANRSPDFQSVLHVDVDSKEVLDHIHASVKKRAPSLAVSNLRDENFFAAFLRGGNRDLFQKARYGVGKSYAAASDVLRYPLIDFYGGIYIDTDDALTASIEGVRLEASSDDLLLGKEVAVPTLEFRGYNNSVFASQPGNPVLARISEEMRLRNLQEPSFFDTPVPAVDRSTPVTELLSAQALRPYKKKVFELTGPSLFNDVLQQQRPDYYSLGTGTPSELQIRSSEYLRRLNDAQEHYFPFKTKAPVGIGNGHDW